MYRFPIGVMLEAFGCETKEAIRKAGALGAGGLQMYVAEGEHSPEHLKGEKAKELLAFVKDNGLKFSALCGDLGRGFGNAELNPSLIEASKKILYLAKELETDVVTTHIGVVPQDKNHDRYKIMQEACHTLAEFADSLEAHFAIETGPETSATLKEFLDSLGSRGVAVNLDPANLAMVTGDDPVQAVYHLKDYIVHTHAKDGNKLCDKDPEIVYGIITAPEDVRKIRSFEEVPLGSGSVPFPEYLKALEDIGYRGYLTIERKVGEEPDKDMKTAFDFLAKTMREH